MKHLRKFMLLLALVAVAGVSAQEAGKKYYIVNYKATTSYLTEDASTAQLKAVAFDETAAQQWEFVSTGTTGCYHIKNVATGNYIAGSTASADDQTYFYDAAEPTEYYVAQGTGSLEGHIRITSTDCSGYATTGSTSPFGLNQSGGNTNVVSWNAGSSNAYSWWTLVDADPEEPGEVETDGKTYLITWYSDASAYMTESSAADPFIVAARDKSLKQYWEFIPTENENCYYIRNKVTGHYIPSCNKTPSSSSKIYPSTEPQEYYVTNGTGVLANYVRFTSTDCTGYATTTSNSPYGLNKDGASSDIITWYAGTGNSGSWWKMVETEFDYDLRPFTTQESIGNPVALYAICSYTSGQALAMTADGTLEWQVRDAGSLSQSWYFVGTSNNGTGWLLVNADGHRPYAISDADTEGTPFCAFAAEEEGDVYTLRPLATASDAATTLTVDGESLLTFRLGRSSFARSAQIYDFPCGTYAAPLLQKLRVNAGASVLMYPLPTASGTNVLEPNNTSGVAFTLYTKDYANVAPGETFTVTAQFAVQTAGAEVFLYFDWNRDGIFETAVPVAFDAKTVSAEVTVPEDAVLGWTRMRLRVTSNGLHDAEDEVIGSTTDFKLRIVEEKPEPDCYCVEVEVNDPYRGTAWVESDNLSAEQTVNCEPANQSTFVCWKEGNHIVAAKQTYTFTYTHALTLTAVFGPSPLTDPVLPTGITKMTESASEVVKVRADERTVSAEGSDICGIQAYTPSGALAAYTSGTALTLPEAGTYIIKVYTTTSGKSIKLHVK